MATTCLAYRTLEKFTLSLSLVCVVLVLNPIFFYQGLIRSDFLLVPGDLISNVKLRAHIEEHKYVC